MMIDGPLPQVPEGNIVLIVMAHPDDAEFGSGGTIARWAAAGKEIHYVLCTSGDKGSSDPDMVPHRLAKIRQEEQTAAALALGAKDVTFLGYGDGILQNSYELRRDIVREIRRFKPDALMCQDPTQRWGGNRMLNHSDHRNAGDAALDSVYPSARDPHAFPELLTQGFEPHKTKEVYVQSMEHADVWVDVSDFIEQKYAGISKHVSQVGPNLSERWEMMKERTRAITKTRNLPYEYAEGFKYFQLS